MNTKQKHAEFIKAWLDGREVEAKTPYGWSKVDNLLAFANFVEFRFARPQWQRDLMDAVRDGKAVEVLIGGEWSISCLNHYSGDDFCFLEQSEYRIRPEVPQWRKDMAKALQNGKVVEARLGDEWFKSNLSVGTWLDPSISLTLQYRINPEPKPDLVRYVFAYASNTWEGSTLTELHLSQEAQDNLKIVFNGETLKPESVTILD